MDTAETISTLSQIGTIVIALGIIVSAVCFVFKKVRDGMLTGLQKGLGIDNLKNEINQIKNEVNQINTTLIALVDALKKNTSINNPEFNLALDCIILKNIESKSPACLTDEGLEKLQESGLDGIIDKGKQYLFGELEKKGVETKFDIQNNAFYVMADYLKDNKEVSMKMKEYAFKKGILALREFTEIGGIYLRDQYLKDKNIPINDKKTMS